MSHKTYDGEPIQMRIEGFSSYDVERTEHPVVPAPVVSPRDILNTLNSLQNKFSNPEIDMAIRRLFIHMNDDNNPHRTDLSQFTEQVIDVLYLEYKAQGGEGSKEFYIQSLFSILRVATLEEMKHSVNEHLLISIKGAILFIRDHENDPDAHKELFDKMFPGDPIVDDPVYALHADIGVSKLLTVVTNENMSSDSVVPYSYTGKDGFIYYCNKSDDLPITYLDGHAFIPCFGTRTNEIAESINFKSLTAINSVLVPKADMSPDKSITATAIGTVNDSLPVEHSITIPKVFLPFNNQKTISVFAKKESCRYLAISYKDLSKSNITVYGIYDLETGTCLTMNHMGRYKAKIHPYGNDFFRCELTMYHEIGQETDLSFTFFKEKKEDHDFSFIGNNEICGYLWGLQLEDGPNASPYIPTAGIPMTRKGIHIKIPLDTEWWSPENMTFNIGFHNPGQFKNRDSARPLCAIVENDVYTALSAHFKRDGELELLRNTLVDLDSDMDLLEIVVYQDLFPETEEKFCQLTHGIDHDKVISLYNKHLAVEANTPKEWAKGDHLFLGSNPHGEFMEGFIRNIVIYPRRVLSGEAVFLNGEELYG